jgi:acetyl esterase/lipase
LALCPYGFFPRQRQKAISVICLFLCLLAAPLFARSSYPPTFEDARVETYRKVGATELKLWIFGESDPKAKKPAIVFFFGGGWHGGTPAQFEDQARHFAKRGMIAITADYRVKSRHGVPVVECVKDAKAAIAWVRENAQRLGIDPTRLPPQEVQPVVTSPPAPARSAVSAATSVPTP